MANPPGFIASFAEAQGFQAIGNFLQAIAAPYPLVVIRQLGNTGPGLNSRVPQPINADFIIMSSIMLPRLSYNITTFADNIFVGSISSTTLTVTSITNGSVPIGALLVDGNYPPGIATNTVIQSQLTGTPGGVGTYALSVSQTVASRNLYAGLRQDDVPSEWVVQLDVHGPNSMNNTKLIDTLFRSDFGVSFFASQGFPVVPLYCGDPRQAPWENAEQQIEFRWTMDLHLQVDMVVSSPQQFADQVVVKPIEAAVQYTG